MKVSGTHYRGIWRTADGTVRVVDQSRLPFEFATLDLVSVEDAARAIETMVVRGAPLIGATAAYGVALALRADPSDAHLEAAGKLLKATRPTAVDLAWAVMRMRDAIAGVALGARVEAAFREAAKISDTYVEQCRAIGAHGLTLIRELAGTQGRRVNVLTHCNAGWLACVDWGTALSPIYLAHDAGIDVHVWVDETRPRNQGAALTAFELRAHGVPHTVIADNLGGHLMQRGDVDLVLVGSDRVTASGDVCNKVGTYLKALAAHDNGVPFYAAMPSSTIDWSTETGRDVPIEERPPRELTHVSGQLPSGVIGSVRVVADGSPALNLGFDVTPARLVTGLITERGICPANRAALRDLHANRRTGVDHPRPSSDAELRAAVVSACRALAHSGLTHGKSGNVSLRCDERQFFISPSGVAYDGLGADEVPRVASDGRWVGRRRPSSEWRFHRDIYRARDDVGAIVHTHSRYATALACTGRGIPAFHYMVAVAGGCDIRCAPYATFGTQELSVAAVAALDGRRACLLGNHGVIAVGKDLPAALALAGEVENLAAQYCAALELGEVRLLDEPEMRRVLEKFRTYGTPAAIDPDLVFVEGS
jgi:methylthioribose-1-phosphate isomerase